MLNTVILMGRVVRDPELRMTPSGTAVTTITLANHTGRKDSGGNEIVNFIDVTAWQEKADFACRYLRKGQKVVVDGHITVNRKKDAAGKTTHSLGVIASSIYFADTPQKTSAEKDEYMPSILPEEYRDDDDLPF